MVTLHAEVVGPVLASGQSGQIGQNDPIPVFAAATKPDEVGEVGLLAATPDLVESASEFTSPSVGGTATASPATPTPSPTPTSGTPDPTETATPTTTDSPTTQTTDPTASPSTGETTQTPSPSPTEATDPAVTDPGEQGTGEDTGDPTQEETGEEVEVPTATVTPGEGITTQGTSTPFVWNTPPAVSRSEVSVLAIVLAAAVLVALAIGVAVFRRSRDGEDPASHGGSAPVRAEGGGAQVAGEAAWVGAAAAAVTEDATEILDSLGDTAPQPSVADTQAVPVSETVSAAALAAGAITNPAPSAATGRGAGDAGGTDEEEGHAQDVSTLLVVLGEALLDCASPVAEVRRTLEAVAAVNGIGKAEVIALPTVILVTIPGARRTYTVAASAGARSYRLDQVGEVLTVADRARSGTLAPAEAVARLRAVAHQPPPHPTWFLTLGYIVYSVGLSLILGGSLLEVVITAGLGALLGILQLATARTSSSLQALVVLVGTFVVSAAVFGLIRLGADISILPSLVPPLVMFLPGALLTTAFIDLSTRQMIAGSARLAAGGMQLVLLALGITAAGHLVGVRSEGIADTDSSAASALAPWLGLAIFLLGVQMYQCVPKRMMPWVSVVTVSAYAGQVLGGVFFGGIVSALVGAAVMTPLAMYASTLRGGPPTLVSFLPAFWVLVPGALGLIGVTQALDSDPSAGSSSLISAAVTMVSISLGVLVGVAAYGIGSAVRNRTSVVVPLLFVRDERLGGYSRHPDPNVRSVDASQPPTATAGDRSGGRGSGSGTEPGQK